MLGYNFSVAVWVGFIALFGTAVQTAVVMVIYLDEALQRKVAERGNRLTRRDVRDAVVEGALLRLRPKLMTVSTVVAGLLPIMWSTRVGAEVMKPLATPVLGGMVSSLLYVLIVTPVLFCWIHERRLRPGFAGGTDALPREEAVLPVEVPRNRRWALVAFVIVVSGLAATAWWVRVRPATTSQAGVVLETVRSGDLVITLSKVDGPLRQGSNRFRIEFHSARTKGLVDVGAVQLGATMTMPGMVMTSPITIASAGQPGVYDATGEYSMAGSWQMTLQWDGPAGRGSAAFDKDVQ
jgi:Cu(I)/Ag(I) efflux system membrane protein CusA/SilA